MELFISYARNIDDNARDQLVRLWDFVDPGMQSLYYCSRDFWGERLENRISQPDSHVALGLAPSVCSAPSMIYDCRADGRPVGVWLGRSEAFSNGRRDLGSERDAFREGMRRALDSNTLVIIVWSVGECAEAGDWLISQQQGSGAGQQNRASICSSSISHLEASQIGRSALLQTNPIPFQTTSHNQSVYPVLLAGQACVVGSGMTKAFRDSAIEPLRLGISPARRGDPGRFSGLGSTGSSLHNYYFRLSRFVLRHYAALRPAGCFGFSLWDWHDGFRGRRRKISRVASVLGETVRKGRLVPFRTRQERKMDSEELDAPRPHMDVGQPAVNESSNCKILPFPLPDPYPKPPDKSADIMPNAICRPDRGEKAGDDDGDETSLVADISLRNFGRNVDRWLADRDLRARQRLPGPCKK